MNPTVPVNYAMTDERGVSSYGGGTAAVRKYGISVSGKGNVGQWGIAKGGNG